MSASADKHVNVKTSRSCYFEYLVALPFKIISRHSKAAMSKWNHRSTDAEFVIERVDDRRATIQPLDRMMFKSGVGEKWDGTR